MKTVSYYLEHGIKRVILGSAALGQPSFVREAVKEFGAGIAVGIDARAERSAYRAGPKLQRQII